MMAFYFCSKWHSPLTPYTFASFYSFWQYRFSGCRMPILHSIWRVPPNHAESQQPADGNWQGSDQGHGTATTTTTTFHPSDRYYSRKTSDSRSSASSSIFHPPSYQDNEYCNKFEYWQSPIFPSADGPILAGFALGKFHFFVLGSLFAKAIARGHVATTTTKDSCWHVECGSFWSVPGNSTPKGNGKQYQYLLAKESGCSQKIQWGYQESIRRSHQVRCLFLGSGLLLMHAKLLFWLLSPIFYFVLSGRKSHRLQELIIYRYEQAPWCGDESSFESRLSVPADEDESNHDV